MLLQTLAVVERVALDIVVSLRNQGKVLLCGNGGSAADAQHLAAELSGRFYLDRPPLFAEALHVNTSYLSAVANDYSCEEIFSRLVQAKGRSGGGRLKDISRYLIRGPSSDTPRIQECHITLGHIICALVEHTIVAGHGG